MNHQDASTKESIRIFVSTHKLVNCPGGSILQPVQVGAATSRERFPRMLHDDQGASISALNPMYCELTTQYWAWKNIEADYYGFCHYRRYFDFSSRHHPQNDYGEILANQIDQATIREYGLDDTSIRNQVCGWDVITSPVNDVRSFGGYHSMAEHYASNPHLRLADLRLMYDILCKAHPDYRIDALRFLDGTKGAFCNMFIMKKTVFREYCEWLFPLLDKFVQAWDHSIADEEHTRTPGHLAERLLNVFLLHQQRNRKDLKVKQLQCVHFKHPEAEIPLEPIHDNHQVVPIVLAADKGYIPMLAATVISILVHASEKYRYDIIVMQRNIGKPDQQTLKDMCMDYPQCTLRFVNIGAAVSGYSLSTNNYFISIETYYRFLIQDLLPFYDKVIYLDSDLVVNEDMGNLYDTDLGNCALGAVKDMDFLGNLGYPDGKRLEYARNVLHMTDPHSYFQAGVLLMNLSILRSIHTTEEWLRLASNPEFMYNDQDILNMECQGKVKFLNQSWNVLHDCADRVDSVFAYAPAAEYHRYIEARTHPRIIHYAGFEKPWVNPWCDMSAQYWRYAKSTPFAHQELALMVGMHPPKANYHTRILSENSPLRKYLDKLIPAGSRRRETAKVVARTLFRHK